MVILTNNIINVWSQDGLVKKYPRKKVINWDITTIGSRYKNKKSLFYIYYILPQFFILTRLCVWVNEPWDDTIVSLRDNLSDLKNKIEIYSYIFIYIVSNI